LHIGISAYFHDSSVALIDDDGNLIDFKKEEYLSRIKGDKAFPRMALNEIISTHNLSENNIKSVTFYEKPLRAWLTVIKYSVKKNSLTNELTRNYFKNIWKSSIIFKYDLIKFSGLSNVPTYYSDHYLSHTLSGLFYKPDKSYAAIVADGYGDSLCSAIHHVKSPENISVVWESEYPHSIGLFYSAITDFLGFLVNEGEYKVMGLAAFGQPIYYNALKSTFDFDSSKKSLNLNTDYYDFVRSTTDSYSKKLIELLNVQPRKSNIHLDLDNKDFQKYADIAASAQKLVEDILIKIFKHAHDITQERNFIFTGGVAMNSVAVNKIAKCEFIDELLIPPSPGDSGAAIGAAYYGFIQKNKNIKHENKKIYDHLFPGKHDQKEDFLCIGMKKIGDEHDSIAKVAKLISENKIIATSFANIETGPRALGHRSMICNAHNENTVIKLNTSIKSRSKFRPTAPVILDIHADKYFNLSQNIIDSYYHMGAIATPKDEFISDIKGVVHVDGTSRVQICNEKQLLGEILTNLSEFGIYVIANTSFNISSDPMVYSKEDAYMSVERMGLDYLLTEHGLYERIPK
jgi:carbamoyltransferase